MRAIFLLIFFSALHSKDIKGDTVTIPFNQERESSLDMERQQKELAAMHKVKLPTLHVRVMNLDNRLFQS
jgi:hypothetical protein